MSAPTDSDSSPASTTVQTAEHVGPAKAPDQRDAAWLCAFPTPKRLPVPIFGDSTGAEWYGREWFRRQQLVDEDGNFDTEVSGQHFVVTGGPDEYSMVDNPRSKNGVVINGKQIDKGVASRLEDGDVVRVGTTLFVHRIDPGEFAKPKGNGEALNQGEGSGPLNSLRYRLISPFGLGDMWEKLKEICEPPTKSGGSYPAGTANTGRTILIEGATGTGKEATAFAIARRLRKKDPAVFNVATLHVNTARGELCGYEKGAFTGADEARKGFIRTAIDGQESKDGRLVLFFDEIGDVPFEIQALFLRILEGRILPVGSTNEIAVNMDCVAATNQNLDAKVRDGTFRADLLMRLRKSSLLVPALNDRIEDIPAIVINTGKSLMKDFSSRDVEVEAMERLMLQWWDGNVRQLVYTVTEVLRLAQSSQGSSKRLPNWAVRKVLGDIPASRIIKREEAVSVLEQCAGNTQKAAECLRIRVTRLTSLLNH